jgi:hypothetical protein
MMFAYIANTEHSSKLQCKLMGLIKLPSILIRKNKKNKKNKKDKTESDNVTTLAVS